MTYEDYDWNNPQEEYRFEREEALNMVPTDHHNALMFALEMAWMRGHHAATELGASEHANPFKKPPAEITSYTDEYKHLLWPRTAQVDTEKEQD